MTTTTVSTGGAAPSLGRRLRQPFSGGLDRYEFLLPLLGLLLVQQIFFPAPLSIVVIGTLYGGRVALVALGIALIYRANRVVNFAQGDLGAVPAALAVMLVVAWNWNYWVGLIVGLVAAVVLGVLVETLIIKRFAKAPRLVLMVATIGLTQVLTFAGLMLPRAFGDDSFGTTLPQAFGGTYRIGGGNFYANDIMTMVLVPVAMVLLAIFLQRSTVGIAIVGAAEKADRALTLGIPVRRLHTVVWVVATVLAFLAMFLRAGTVGLPIGEVLGPLFLVQALGAAVFGRFSRFTTIAAAAIGIGIVDQSMVFNNYRPGENHAVMFLIVLVGMLVARRNGSGRIDAEASTWQATREVRPIPRELAGLPEVQAVRVALWVALGAFVLTLPAWMSNSQLFLATSIVLFAMVAASLVVLSGWAGQVSLGHMAFVGLGAAAGGMITEKGLVDASWGHDLALSFLAAGLVGAVAAVIVGYPALRRRGLTLAVSTLAFALITSSYLLNRTFFDFLPERRLQDDTPTLFGSIQIDNEVRLFYLSVAVLLVALAMVTGLRRSRTGRVFIAIRENERAAAAFGVNTLRTSMAAFALSGFIAAVAGSLFIHQQSGLTADLYLPERSLELFSMVVIGGLGSLPGALLGATYVRGADYFLPLEWKFLASGAGLLLILLLLPSGLGGLLSDIRDAGLRKLARRRGIVVPSLLADVRVEEDEAPMVAAESVEATSDEPSEPSEPVEVRS